MTPDCIWGVLNFLDKKTIMKNRSSTSRRADKRRRPNHNSCPSAKFASRPNPAIVNSGSSNQHPATLARPSFNSPPSTSLGLPPAPFPAMVGPGPEVLELSPGINWDFILQQTVSFAEYQIDRLSWRGEFGGVLPQGFDASSLAAQALSDFLVATPNLLPNETKPRSIGILSD